MPYPERMQVHEREKEYVCVCVCVCLVFEFVRNRESVKCICQPTHFRGEQSGVHISTGERKLFVGARACARVLLCASGSLANKVQTELQVHNM